MSESQRFKTEPVYPMNRWVREALEHSRMTQQAVADRLSARPELGNYTRSTVQKMMKDRRVPLDEARAVSEITGYPLPRDDSESDLADKIGDLSPENRAIVASIVDVYLASQAAKK